MKSSITVMFFMFSFFLSSDLFPVTTSITSTFTIHRTQYVFSDCFIRWSLNFVNKLVHINLPHLLLLLELLSLYDTPFYDFLFRLNSFALQRIVKNCRHLYRFSCFLRQTVKIFFFTEHLSRCKTGIQSPYFQLYV